MKSLPRSELQRELELSSRFNFKYRDGNQGNRGKSSTSSEGHVDWREQFMKRPVAWTAGALGAGFLVGYGVAACVSGDDYDQVHYSASAARPLTSNAYLPASGESINAQPKSNGKRRWSRIARALEGDVGV